MLLSELKAYFFVGGMPESVKTFRDEGSMRASFEVLEQLTETYRDDFAKYARRADPLCLDEVFVATARSVGSRIKYSHLSRNHTNAKVHRAFDLLARAEVIRKVRSANPPHLPLGASASEKRFKALTLDLGICHQMCGVRPESIGDDQDLLDLYRGSLAEQFVGQELVATQGRDLYFWARESKSSSAEVDFLATVGGRVHPVEVKAGAAGRLRSLHLLLESHPDLGDGLVFSTAPYSRLPEQRIEFLPLYYAYSRTQPDRG
jgi:predicted AAA+ superfamily ATPase